MLKVSHGIRVAFVEKNVVSRHRVLTTKELPPNPPQYLLQISKTVPTPHPPKKQNKTFFVASIKTTKVQVIIKK